MTETLFTFRASSAPAWLECGAREEWRLTSPTDSRAVVSVAAEYGRAVHAAVTGQAHEPAQYVDFDHVTPTRRAMRRQIVEGVENAERAIANHSICPVAAEEELSAAVLTPNGLIKVTGHIDLVSETDASGVVDIIDLKTGRMDPVKVWPQLAVYAWLANEHFWKLRDIIVVSVPRGQTARHVEVLTKRASDMVDYGRQIIQRVTAPQVRQPGLHCFSCPAAFCMFNRNPEQWP